MKKTMVLAALITALSWGCGSEPSGTDKGTDSLKALDSTKMETKDSIEIGSDSLPNDTATAIKGDDAKKESERLASWANKVKGLIVGDFKKGGDLRISLPDEVLKITAFRDFLKEGHRITKAWVETQPGGKYYLCGNSFSGEQKMSIAKTLVRSGDNLMLAETGVKIYTCEAAGCEACVLKWDAQGNFKQCDCGGDSRRNCKYTVQNK
jgi:hypothetical protein